MNEHDRSLRAEEIVVDEADLEGVLSHGEHL